MHTAQAAAVHGIRYSLPVVLFAVSTCLIAARPAAAQVSGSVELRDGRGSALIRNPSAQSLRVRVALWESDESGDRVELVREARANLWPTEFELPGGETQVIRLMLEDRAYAEGTLLRLETRMVPIEPVSGATSTGATARVILATRILSKVLVR